MSTPPLPLEHDRAPFTCSRRTAVLAALALFGAGADLALLITALVLRLK